MFTHLNFEFDLNGGKITAETAAKDYHGVPLYQYVYDMNAPEIEPEIDEQSTQTSTEPTNEESVLIEL